MQELLDILQRLNNSNRFAVLVYARMKHAFQMAGSFQPHRLERRRPFRVQYNAHWLL